MKDYSYSTEKIIAREFIISHNADEQLMDMLNDVRSMKYTHSEKWSIIYDFMKEHYPSATGTLITGMTYYVEEWL